MVRDTASCNPTRSHTSRPRRSEEHIRRLLNPWEQVTALLRKTRLKIVRCLEIPDCSFRMTRHSLCSLKQCCKILVWWRACERKLMLAPQRTTPGKPLRMLTKSYSETLPFLVKYRGQAEERLGRDGGISRSASTPVRRIQRK